MDSREVARLKDAIGRIFDVDGVNVVVHEDGGVAVRSNGFEIGIVHSGLKVVFELNDVESAVWSALNGREVAGKLGEAITCDSVSLWPDGFFISYDCIRSFSRFRRSCERLLEFVRGLSKLVVRELTRERIKAVLAARELCGDEE